LKYPKNNEKQITDPDVADACGIVRITEKVCVSE